VVGAKGISGMREFVTPEGPDQCGFHVDPYSPYDIAQGILHIFEEDSKADFLGQNARQQVLENFTWRHAAENTIRVYSELLDEQ
jgi:glycosyltransferase involved in cell wall biosynthesis